jgi:hypothetical protein
MDDCIFEVYKFLSVEDLINCTLVNKQFYKVTKNEVLWKGNVKDLIKFDGSYYESFKFNYGLGRVNKYFKLDTKIKNIYKTGIFKLNLYNIKIIPTQIYLLPNLKHLDLRCNVLFSIPTEIGLCTNLITLDLFDNQIKKLPSELGNLSNLNFLGCSNNLIENVPMELCNLLNLTYLDLSRNCIETIPDELYKLPKLKNIYPCKIKLKK